MTKNKKNNPDLASEVEVRSLYLNSAIKRLTYLSGFSLLCLIASGLLSMKAINQESNNVYFATDDSFRMQKLIALNAPNTRDANVIAWTSQALINTFDFNFSNIHKQLANAAATYFTESGGNELIRELTENGNFNSVIKNKLIVNISLKHNPLIIKKYVDPKDGRFKWILEVEGKTTYRTQSQVYSTTMRYSVTVQRISLLEDPKGLGISRVIMTKVKD
ncbi:DotI/IcmL family type IV secretion protein [Vibrio splendidus]